MIRGVFGLNLEGFDDPAVGRLRYPTPRTVTVTESPPDSLAEARHEGDWTEVTRLHERDGRLAWVAEHDRAAGQWRIWGPEYGACILTADGQTLAVSRPATGQLARALILGQALPLAALLQGLEPFHASAVSSSRGVVAFSGPPESGKSTLAAEALSRGAKLVTDDVLAMEVIDGRTVGHPGTAELRLRHPGDHRAARDDRRRNEIRVTRVDRPAPMGVFCLLVAADASSIRPCVREITFEPREILAGSFNYMVQDPARLTGQLELCAHLRDAVAMVRIERAPDDSPDQVLDALEAALDVKWQ